MNSALMGSGVTRVMALQPGANRDAYMVAWASRELVRNVRMAGWTFFGKVHSTRWLVICLGLTACSSIETAPQDPGPPPDFVKVKPFLTGVASEYHILEGLEVAGPIRANSASSIPWIMCLRSASTPRKTYAAFFNGDKYVQSRMSLIADRCDGESYRPFPK